MVNLLIVVCLFISIVSCTKDSPSNKKQPEEFVGTWKSEENDENIKLHYQNYANGKSVAIGIAHGELFAYEADWWVEGEYYAQRITKILHTSLPFQSMGEVTKDRIEFSSRHKHILKEGDDHQQNTYVRISDGADRNKYQRIDLYLKNIWPALPQDHGEGMKWLSVFRDRNTLVYMYQMLNLTKIDFDPVMFKKIAIESIQKDPNLAADLMNFKFIYLLSDQEMKTVHITPKDYHK